MKQSWIDYFINIAKTVALKSKDESSKVGCVIVDQDNRIVSTGYNGMVTGCDESLMGWKTREEKYLTVIHSEVNAVLYARRDLRNCVAIVTHGPCENCLKILLQSGIKEIHFDNPSIIRDRGTQLQKQAITNLIKATGAKVVDTHGNNYADLINGVDLETKT